MPPRAPGEIAKVKDWIEKYRAACKRTHGDENELKNALEHARLPGMSVTCADEDINEEMRALSDLFNLFSKQSEEEGGATRAAINSVKRSVRDTTEMINEIDSGNIEPDDLQDALTKTNTELSDTKSWLIKRYEELQNSFVLLDRELESLNRRFEGNQWGLADERKRRRRESEEGTIPSIATTTLPRAVLEFEDFISRTGGHTGGWDSDDHTKYMRAIQRAPTGGKGRNIILEKLAVGLALHNLESVIDHDVWFQRYSDLDAKRRDSVRKWKEDKKKINTVVEVERDDNENDEEKERKELVEAKKRAEQQKKIIEWKARQESQRQWLEHKKQQEREEGKKREAERLKRKRATASAKLAEWEQMKKEVVERDDVSDERATELDTATIARLRKREEETEKRQLARRQKRAQEQQQRLERQSELAEKSRQITSVRDPNRLFQKTDAARRREADRETDGQRIPGILSVGHRAVPEWRKGL